MTTSNSTRALIAVAGQTSNNLRMLISGLILVLIAWALWAVRSRTNRGAALREVPPPLVAFDEPGGLVGGPFVGKYLGTTRSGDWLARIRAHDLSVAGPVSVAALGAGLLFTRAGALDLAIPVNSIAGVRRAKGLAGKEFETDGVVIVSWRLGGHLVDTGVRSDSEADRSGIVLMIRGMLGGQSGLEEGS